MPKKAKIWLVVAAVFLFVVIVFVGAGMYVGAFSSVDVSEGFRGPYDFVYLMHKGPYQLVGEKIKRVEQILKEKNIQQGFLRGKKPPQNHLKTNFNFLSFHQGT